MSLSMLNTDGARAAAGTQVRDMWLKDWGGTGTQREGQAVGNWSRGADAPVPSPAP
jgi:hypothetical protein